MADTSPLVNLDLVNRIYRTINAQIAERVYDPQYNSQATLGDTSHRYVNAYLKALDVANNISAGTLNNLTLSSAATGFTIKGGTTTPKTLTIADTITVNKPLTVGAATGYTGGVTVQSSGSLPTTIQGPDNSSARFLVTTTVGDSTNNGSVTVKSAGKSPTTIIGPNNSTAQFNVKTIVGATSTNTGAVTIQSSGSSDTIIQGPSGETAAFNVATTIGATSGNTGAVEIKSAGANKTAITGPDNGSVTFTTPTDTVQGTVIIKDASTTSKTSIIGVSTGKSLKTYANATIGSTSNTGDVSIQPNGTNKLTINGPSNSKDVNLIDGTYQNSATIACSTDNNASEIVQRDASGDILVRKINGITLTDGTASFTVTGGSSTSKTLTINSPATLGSSSASENGAVTVKSAGAKSTTIIGPNNGTAQFSVATTIGDPTNTGSVTIKSGGTSGTTIIGPNNSIAQFNVKTTVGATSTNTGAVTIRSSSSGATTITSPSDKEAALIGGTYTDSAITENNATPIENKLLKIGKISANQVLVGPTSGENAVPTYRKLTSDDLPTIPYSKGGTGITTYAKGDILYASADDTLSKLTKGSDGQVLKLSNGVPTWGTDNNSDTKNTAGASNTTDQIYLIGAKTQGDNPQTYSHSKVYVTNGELYASAVHNAVWNDLADCIEVPEDTELEFGYCYYWNGDRVEKTSRRSKNCIGIHSNTVGLFMGEKPVKTIQAAVAGFVLAHIDKVYPEGTPLTWSDDGKLTKCTALKRILHPERVIATFYKEEKQESWYGVEVNNRHWVKVR